MIEKYGRLLVLETYKAKKGTRTRTFCKCLCDCGNITHPCIDGLKDGRIQSCGCYKKDQVSKRCYTGGKYMTGAELAGLRKNAQIRNLEFSITAQDVDEVYEKQNKKCNLSGIDIIFNSTQLQGNGKIIRGNASVDRKDNSKGYTKDNIQILHMYVNEAKWDRSQEDFIEMCTKIYKYLNGDN